MSARNSGRSKLGALGSKAADLLAPPGQSLFQKTEDPPPPSDPAGSGLSAEDSEGEPMFRKNCNLPRNLYKKLKYYAFENGVSETSVMVEAIRTYLANRERQ